MGAGRLSAGSKPRPRLRLRALLIGLLHAVPSLATESGGISFLYVESNEGGAGGGHAGLRVGDEVFHYQHVEDTLQLKRSYWDAFAYEYTRRGNRPLHELRIQASPSRVRALERVLRREYRQQQRSLAALEALQHERALLASLVSDEAGSRLALEVPGAGYFAAAETRGAPALDWIDPVAVALRRAGAQEMRASLYPGRPTPPPRGALGPPADYGWGQRLDDLAAAEAALDVIAGTLMLRGQSLRVLSDRSLNAETRARLGARVSRQRRELAELVAGSRPDWGHAFLIGLARVLAIEASLAQGQLAVLDAFPAASERLPPETWEHPLHARTGRALLERSDRELQRALEELDDSALAYARLERAVNRRIELRDALQRGRHLRLHGGAWAPDRSARRSLALAWRPAADELARVRSEHDATLRDWQQFLRSSYRYQVARHNCVSALFDALASVAPNARAWRGPRPGTPARLIPWLAAHWVGANHVLEARRVHAPERERRLRDAFRADGGVAARLRETNVWTSTVYAPHPGDSSFLFFTQDRAWNRPLLGSANLANGAFATALGLLKLPWERETLEAGLGGLFWSLPELVFVNVRKGTYPILLPETDLPGTR